MNKTEFIEKVRAGREEWDALVAQFDEARMEEHGADGEMSAKDVIAHITWYEREMVAVLQARSFTVGSKHWYLPTQDERNAAIYEEIRNLPLRQVFMESKEVSQQLLGELEKLEEIDLTDPSPYPGMPPEWQPWNIIAQNTYEHYEVHIPAFQGMLSR